MKFKLKDIADITMGQSPKGQSYNNKKDGKAFLQGRKTFGRMYPTIDTWTTEPKKIAKSGSVLMSVRAPVGDINIANDEICIGRGLCSINAKNGNNRYLYYLLLYNKANIIKKSSGTVFDSINKEQLEETILNVHKDKEQSKIVSVLNTIDEKIELNTQTNNNLYEMCNKIYHNYLKQYSNLIKYKKIRGISKKIVTGKTPLTRNEMFWNGKIPFITIPDMHNQVFITSTERNITECGAKAIIPKNSILVSCIATVGLVSISTEKSQTNQQINSIILENDYDLYFLFEFLSEQRNLLKNIAGGSTTYNINKHTFENIEVPCLSKEKLIEFNNIVADMFEKIKLNQNENKTLEQLRDILLPKLMNGEIDLDKIEI